MFTLCNVSKIYKSEEHGTVKALTRNVRPHVLDIDKKLDIALSLQVDSHL